MQIAYTAKPSEEFCIEIMHFFASIQMGRNTSHPCIIKAFKVKQKQFVLYAMKRDYKKLT